MANPNTPRGRNRAFVNGTGFWIGVVGLALLMLIVVVFVQGSRERPGSDVRNSDATVPAQSKQIPQPQ